MLRKDNAKIQELVDELSDRIKTILSKYENVIEFLKEIPGFRTKMVEDLVVEIGFDISHLPPEKHLASWAGVCPSNNESAGKKVEELLTETNKWKRSLQKPMVSNPHQEYILQWEIPPYYHKKR